MIDTNKNPYGRGKTIVTVDPIIWAEEKVQNYIKRLEEEIARQDKEIQSLLWKLAAVYEEGKTSKFVEELHELIDRHDI